MAALAAASIRDKRRRQQTADTLARAHAEKALSIAGSIAGGAGGGRRGSEAPHDSETASRIVVESGRSSADWEKVREGLLNHRGEVRMARECFGCFSENDRQRDCRLGALL